VTEQAEQTNTAPTPEAPGETGAAHTVPQVKKRRWRVSRRGLLIGAGVTGGALALGFFAGVPYARLKIAEAFDGASAPSSFTEDPWAWFEITPDNEVRLFVSKAEMGQGVHTSIAQIGADELGIGLDDLQVVQATTAIGPSDSFGTSGSASVSSVYAPLRQAAATLREMLRTEAAAILSVAPRALTADGPAFVTADNPDQRITFGELVASKSSWEVPEEAAPLKAESDFTLIGQPAQRVDIPGKVTGQTTYGYDIRLDGMKYGAVVRPPTIEANMTAVAPGAANSAPGVHTVVADKDFAGVVADSRAAARAAAAQIDVSWDEGKLWQQDEIEKIVTVGNGRGITIQQEGNAPRVLEQRTDVTAEYRTPFAVQASLEPQAAAADVRPDSVRVWVSTQMHGRLKPVVADAIGVDEEIVEVIPTYIGGGFGRKSGFEVAVEAARLSQAAGLPVHVGWDRTEEMRYGYFRPPTHHQLYAALDDRGRLEAIEHRQASGDVAFDFLPGAMAAVMGADFGAYRGATIRYAVPNRKTIAWRTPVPVRTGWWRGLGLLANTYAVESFIDEVALAAGADPLQFRIDHMPNDDWGRRGRAVLEAVGELANWSSPPADGRGRGIAFCSDVDTLVAQVAEVSLDDAGGLRIHDIYAAMDCGLTVNPDGARAQIEGNVMWGVGSTLFEEMQVVDGQVAIDNFNNYPLLTMQAAPKVKSVLLEAGDGVPRGVGEPPIGPVSAAIANALANLSGTRVRTLPMTPTRIQAALSQA
jgi:isoquinoline 1-oxidoreductase beta subunit